MWFFCYSFNVFKSALGRKSSFRGILGFNGFWLTAVKAEPNSNENKNKLENRRYVFQHNSEKTKGFIGFKDT